MAPGTVYVLAETTGEGKPTALTRELLGLGADLASRYAEELHAILVGEGVKEAAEEIASSGADEVHVADNGSLREYNPENHRDLLVRFFEQNPEGVLLAGHTRVGEDLMPRLAFATDSGLVTDTVAVEAGETPHDTVFVKPVFGGNALVSFKVDTPLEMATVRSRVGREPSSAGGNGRITPMELQETLSRVEVRERVAEEKGVRLEEAPVVVSGGRGIGGEQGFEKLQELADLLGGAVGASRPPVDSGWIPSPCQVGLTGKIVAPDLYIAVAISGSSQHLSGMCEAGKIVAINKDPDAHIFKVSDYGVVGDWARVLPAFTERLKNLMEG